MKTLHSTMKRCSIVPVWHPFVERWKILLKFNHDRKPFSKNISENAALPHQTVGYTRQSTALQLKDEFWDESFTKVCTGLLREIQAIEGIKIRYSSENLAQVIAEFSIVGKYK